MRRQEIVLPVQNKYSKINQTKEGEYIMNEIFKE